MHDHASHMTYELYDERADDGCAVGIITLEDVIEELMQARCRARLHACRLQSGRSRGLVCQRICGLTDM